MKIKKLFTGAAITVILIGSLFLTTAGVNGYFGGGGAVFDSNSPNSSTNFVQSYPQAMGTNVVGGSLLWSDVTNLVEIPFGPSKDLSLEFIAQFAGGAGASGSTSNAVLRFVYTDRNLNTPLTTTNAVANYTFASYWTWTMPVTIAAGVGTLDVITNLNNNVAPPAMSATHGHLYLYDITWNPVTNAAAYMSNYHLYFNGK